MHPQSSIAEKCKEAGLRPTRQRIMLGSLLWADASCTRHVTAEQLHSEARAANMQVSMATVYNTLHQFVQAGLLRNVAISGGSSFFDTNTAAHHHFLCEDTGEVADIPADQIQLVSIPKPPCEGKYISSVDVVVRVRA